MEITFKYKNKIISTPNLEKKLKRMKLSLEDIEIINKDIIKDLSLEEDNGVVKYYFMNDEGYRICSIYPECPDNYKPCTKQEYCEITL